MLTVSALYIYPVKSLGGIALQEAYVTSTGFQFDRKWMLIDEHNRFLSQRELPEMALLQTGISAKGINVFSKKDTEDSIVIPFKSDANNTVQVSIWDDVCNASLVDEKIDKWFSDRLNRECRLVYMPQSVKRAVDKNYAFNNELTAFSDGYPFMLIGQSSLDDLNSKLDVALPMDRFRPNIVFTGGEPYHEDGMKEFTIGKIKFKGVKLCGRCVITTIDQNKGVKNTEPLKTLSSYRQKENKVYFGQNLIHDGNGSIKTGDTINIIKTDL